MLLPFLFIYLHSLCKYDILKYIMINRITFTGADESVRPQELYNISGNDSYVEWGILLSQSRKGTPRYPNDDWLFELADTAGAQAFPLRISLHLCGSIARDIIEGVAGAWEALPQSLINVTQRIQFNYKYVPNKTVINPNNFINNLIPMGSNKEYIFQYTQNNISLHNLVKSSGLSTSLLYDDSGGLGMTPIDWSPPFDDVYTGYAGSLGPDNLEKHIQRINLIVGNSPAWIDMETKVRSKGVINTNKEDKFDFDKIIQCVDKIRPVIGPQV